MAIQDSDIKFYYSGGASNTDPAQSFGGPISNNEIPDDVLANLFDHVFQESRDVGATDSTTPGTKDYRVIYTKIDIGAVGSGINGLSWLSENTTIEQFSYRMAIGAINTEVTKPVNENTITPGVTFQAAPDNEGSALALPDVSAGDYFGICIERSLSVSNQVQDSKGITITTQWDSA